MVRQRAGSMVVERRVAAEETGALAVGGAGLGAAGLEGGGGHGFRLAEKAEAEGEPEQATSDAAAAPNSRRGWARTVRVFTGISMKRQEATASTVETRIERDDLGRGAEKGPGTGRTR